MSKKVSSFGMLMLVISTAIVLLLVAKAWESMAPTAMHVETINELSTGVVRSSSEETDEEAGGTKRRLPGLNDLRRETNQHSQDVQDTLNQIDGE